MGMLEDHLTEAARMRERDQKIADLQAELDKAHHLVGQSIQWQRDAEIKLLKLRAATIEEYAKPLEQIRQVCADNAGEASNHKMALDFVHQIAIRALEEQPPSYEDWTKAIEADILADIRALKEQP